MKLKEGFILKEIVGNHLVVPIGSNLVDFNAIMTLNDTGAFLWEQLQTDKDVDELVNAMCKEYDIGKDAAKNDVEEFVNTLKSTNLFE